MTTRTTDEILADCRSRKSYRLDAPTLLDEDALGSHWCGNTCPPGSNLDTRIGDCYVVATRNDGFEVFIGYEHEWKIHFRFPDAMRLVRFIVWDWWVKGMGCGLRRWAWYKLLSRRVRRYQAVRKTDEEEVG